MCPRCHGCLAWNFEEWFCINCGARPENIPLPEAFKLDGRGAEPGFRRTCCPNGHVYGEPGNTRYYEYRGRTLRQCLVCRKARGRG